MLNSILGNLFGNKTETKKAVSNSVLNRIRRRKSIVQKFKNISPNDNLKRAKTAKELLSVSRTEGERKAARKFYKDETALNNLKNRIKASSSINEKLSLARQGKRLATKQQKEFWENLINRLQNKKQERKDAIIDKKEILTTDTDKEQDMEKDTEEIKEEKEQDIDENESGEDSNNDIEKEEEGEEAEEDSNEDDNDDDDDSDDNDDENDNEEDSDGTIGNSIDNNDHNLSNDDTDNENKS